MTSLKDVREMITTRTANFITKNTFDEHRHNDLYPLKKEIVAANYATKGDLASYVPLKDIEKLRGPQGPAGPVGTVGQQGPNGIGLQKVSYDQATGNLVFTMTNNTSQGPFNVRGAQGLVGPAGAIGPQGPVGKNGAQGPVGPAGAIGPQGPAGNYANTFDFVLGNGNQRDRGDTGLSRALVKDGKGQLTINYANDFAGGVNVYAQGGLRVLGNAVVNGNAFVNGNVDATSFTLGGKPFTGGTQGPAGPQGPAGGPIFNKPAGFDKPAVQIGVDNHQPDDTNIFSLSFGKAESGTNTGMGMIPNNKKVFPDTAGPVLGTHIKAQNEWGIYSDAFTPLFHVQGGTGNIRPRGQVNLIGKNVVNFGSDQDKEVNAGKIGYGTFDNLASLNIVGAGKNGEKRNVRIWDNVMATNAVAVGDMPRDWRGANFQRADGKWTHFDWKDDARNYIRGDTVHDGAVSLQDNPLYVRAMGDGNNVLQWNKAVDGPRLAGCGGGQLNTVCGGEKTALTWNKNGVFIPPNGADWKQQNAQLCIGPKWCFRAEGDNGEYLVLRDMDALRAGKDSRYAFFQNVFKQM